MGAARCLSWCCLVAVAVVLRGDAAPLQAPVDQAEDQGHATETQHAICVVTSEDAVATARATITRVINSSCTEQNMERFSKLEKDIADQNHMIRYLLHLMEMHYNQNHESMYLRSSAPMPPSPSRGATQPQQRPPGGMTVAGSPDAPQRQASTPWSPVDSLTYRRQEETLDNYAHLQSAEPSSREAEIDRYNSSLLTDPQGHLTFNYYWRVHRALEMPENTTIRSQSFYVSSGSYRMYLSYWSGTFLHMAGIGLSHGEHDALLQWPFNLTVRLSILAQNHRKDYMRDLSSASIKPSLFSRCHSAHWQKPRTSENPSCFMLSYSRDLLHTDAYLHKGAVLLHLSVLLAK